MDTRILCLAVLTLSVTQINGSSAAEKQTVPRAAADNEQSIRNWSDANGTRTARARLIRVEDDTVLLRTEDGRLAQAALAELSEADRQFVASQRRTPSPATAAQSDSSPSAAPALSKVVDKVVNGLPALKDAASLLTPITRDAQEHVNPAGLLYVRVSNDFIDRQTRRSVDKHGPVRDVILGTDIYGESNTAGESHLVLLPSDGVVKAEIRFEGMVHSRTTGYNGPAILHYVSTTPFRARKTITITESGWDASEPEVSTTTNLQTTGIQTTLPRLRGRIASWIAARRNASSHQEAEAITARHTADRIGRDFDRASDGKIAQLEKVFSSTLSRLAAEKDQPKPIIRMRSNKDYAELAMIRGDAREDEWKVKPPRIEGNPDVAVRLSRSLVGRILADSELSQQFAPLIARFSNGALNRSASIVLASEKIPDGNPPKVSMDANWVTVDLASPSAGEVKIVSRPQ